jgi:hypothetical protein
MPGAAAAALLLLPLPWHLLLLLAPCADADAHANDNTHGYTCQAPGIAETYCRSAQQQQQVTARHSLHAKHVPHYR